MKRLAYILISFIFCTSGRQSDGYLNVSDFIRRGHSDAEALDACIAAAPNNARTIRIDRDLILDRAVLLPSHTLLLIDGVTVKQADGTFDNVFRGANVVLKDDDPAWIPDTIAALEDIRIIGRNGARIVGPDLNRTSGTRFMTGDNFGGRTHQFNFCFVKGMEISGLLFKRTRGWAMEFEYCEDVAIHDIRVESMDMDRNRYGNGDGLDIRSGCRKFRVWNFSGNTEDDLIAINTMQAPGRTWPDGQYLYPNEFSYRQGERLLSRNPRAADISNIKLERIHKDGGQFHAVILFSQSGHQIYNVRIFDVCISGNPRPAAASAPGWVSVYAFNPSLYHPGDIHDITIRGIRSSARGTVPFASMLECRDLTVEDVVESDDLPVRSDTLRILGIGNSWTRDCMRYLSAIASSAGKPVIVGHGYLGGSTLVDQLHGICDTSYEYIHNGKQQKVHSTYQYWKYKASDDPVKIPSEGYENGLAGIGVTLDSIVKDESWDWVVFQPEATFGGNWRICGLEELMTSIKEMMEPGVAARVKTALMVPFAYPKGNTDYRKRFVEVYNGGRTPKNQTEWDNLYRKQYRLIQKAAPVVCKKLKLDACINVGKAIEACRHDESLSGYGYLLQRRQNNTHLAEGMPKYLASLCYAYTLLDLKPEDILFCPPGAEENADKARKLVWKELR